jgi:hypothetical protein
MAMRGVELRDMHPRGYLAFDLKDILQCLGDDVLTRTWRCTHLECTGEATRELEEIETGRVEVSGARLLELALRTNQVVWGDFLGRKPNELNLSLILRAIDSSLWEVFGNEDCLRKLSHSFRDVHPTDASADPTSFEGP